VISLITRSKTICRLGRSLKNCGTIHYASYGSYKVFCQNLHKKSQYYTNVFPFLYRNFTYLRNNLYGNCYTFNAFDNEHKPLSSNYPGPLMGTLTRLVNTNKLLFLNVCCVLVYAVFCCVPCVLYGPFCHGAHKLDLSTLFTTFFLWTSLPFILLNTRTYKC